MLLTQKLHFLLITLINLINSVSVLSEYLQDYLQHDSVHGYIHINSTKVSGAYSQVCVHRIEICLRLGL